MKILIVMDGFFPGMKYGGPPVSVDNFCSLMDKDDCYIITRDHDLFDKEKYQEVKEGWNDRENCKVKYISDAEYNKLFFEEEIKTIHPDLLYLQGLYQPCVLPCLQLAKKYKIRVLLAPRGELCSGALKIKTWKKLLYIKALNILGIVKNVHWQSTSDEETSAILKLMNTKEAYVHRLDNIPSIPKKEYSRREKIAGVGRFIFLSRIHPKKNLLSAITFFENVNGKVWFDIYGPIEDKEYWDLCQEACKKVGDNVRIEYKGIITHDQVHELFSGYDAFLFPTLSENYGHVIAESMIVGTPAIISDQTPWTNINQKDAGWAIPLNSPLDFSKAIQKIVDSDDSEMRALSNRAMEYARVASNLDFLQAQYNQVIGAILE